ncbi:hypothetical protein SAMN05661096_03473 [Marivirga sericea]|uniref:Uncharacterized protein n=1 Tax=Marivirga sericea TaxID=1028 RepID=A0A1X7L3M0_9BACT|nr:hypothetical protein [Marivirga sericea]SMG48471.1 hypothetical protein SAMN05661096_03473 [Marivirga sericea]
MKKQKLKKFNEFILGLLPHETTYLLKKQQFADPDNLTILKQTHEKVAGVTPQPDFSTHIDKRKYSRMIHWISENLNSADVDKEFDQLIQLEKKLMNDAISTEDEQILLTLIKNTDTSHYYFMKRFELAMHLLNYLLVRMRHKEYNEAVNFVNRYKHNYDQCRLVYGRIQEATFDITNQYTFNDKESRQWESWLLTIFRDPMMDGMNRYYALVRLIFLYYNYNQQEQMENLFEEVEPLLESGNFYSKRILINYYGNRLLFHSKANQLDLAEKYGYLSIRVENSDFLHYVNNLNTVLLKKGKTPQALSLMKTAFPEAKKSANFHHRVSFVASYVRCLTDSEELNKAITHAEIFLSAYKKELLEHRWHFFFTVYFRALFLKGHYRKILQYISKFKLLEREEKYLQKISSVATLEWYSFAASYKSEKIELNELRKFSSDFLKIYDKISNRSKAVNELLKDTQKVIPELF